MPPLLMVLAAVMAIGPIFLPDAPVEAVVAISGLYMADYFSAIYGDLPVLLHTWSLSVEEHFYMIWPVAVLGLVSLPPMTRVKAIALAFAVATLWRLGNAYYFPAFSMTAFRFDTRLSGLLLGALVAISAPVVSTRAADLLGWIAVASLAVLSSVANREAVPMAYMQPFIDIAAAALIVSLIAPGTSVGRVFSWRPVAYIGLISYSIYLWHYPIALAVKTCTGDWRIILAVTLALSVALAAASYAFVEKPLQAWRHRRFAIA